MKKHIKNLLVEVEKAKGMYKSLHDLNFNLLVKLNRKLENPEYVISIMGAMKSGKSTFINALLGNDFMPSENEACTLTTTDIVLSGESDNRIHKIFESGKKDVLEGNNLSETFLEEVRQSRRKKTKEKFTYKVSHPIHALKNKKINSKLSFVLMDTPGINEMESAGIDKEILINSFNESILRTDLLLFVIDCQYYKAEENENILNHIKSIRPDLLKNAVFVINKIDKLTNKDKSLKDLVLDIQAALRYWGIQRPNIYTVSSKKALFGRVLIKDVHNGYYKKEIDPFLELKEININGMICSVNTHSEEAYQEVVGESGIEKFEDDILSPIYNNFNKVYKLKVKKLSKEAINEISVQLKEMIHNYSQQVIVNQKEVNILIEHTGLLEILLLEQQKTERKLYSYLNKKELMKHFPIGTVFDPEVSSAKKLHSNEIFTSKNDAVSNRKSILEKNLKPYYSKRASDIKMYYSKELTDNKTQNEFFIPIIEVVKEQIKSLNKLILSYSEKYPTEIIKILNEEFFIKPGDIKGQEAKTLTLDGGKSDRYQYKVEIKLFYEKVPAYFLFIIPTTRMEERFQCEFYGLLKFIEMDIKNYSKDIFHEMNKIKYEDFPTLLKEESIKRTYDLSLQINNRLKELALHKEKLIGKQSELNIKINEIVYLMQVLKDRETIMNTKLSQFKLEYWKNKYHLYKSLLVYKKGLAK